MKHLVYFQVNFETLGKILRFSWKTEKRSINLLKSLVLKSWNNCTFFSFLASVFSLSWFFEGQVMQILFEIKTAAAYHSVTSILSYCQKLELFKISSMNKFIFFKQTGFISLVEASIKSVSFVVNCSDRKLPFIWMYFFHEDLNRKLNTKNGRLDWNTFYSCPSNTLLILGIFEKKNVNCIDLSRYSKSYFPVITVLMSHYKISIEIHLIVEGILMEKALVFVLSLESWLSENSKSYHFNWFLSIFKPELVSYY